MLLSSPLKYLRRIRRFRDSASVRGELEGRTGALYSGRTSPWLTDSLPPHKLRSFISETKEDAMNPLTGEDYELIFESLRYTKEAFTKYDGYPNADFRRSRIEAVDTAITHLRELQQG
jgi:hypothetical protein